jgi:hypothetical protein
MLWYTPVTPLEGRLRQEDHEFEDRLVYITRPCLQKKKEKSMFFCGEDKWHSI